MTIPDRRFLSPARACSGAGDGPRRYLADASGHVISFGDENLALLGIHNDANDGLMWEIKSANASPDPDAKVTLRLRPQRTAAGG